MEYILFKCTECGSLITYPSWTADGRRCSECNGYIIGKAKGTKKELSDVYGNEIVFNQKHTPGSK